MFLKLEFAYVKTMERPAEALALLREQEFDAILLDMNFKKGVNDGEEGFAVLEKILQLDPHAVVIPITAYGELDLAVRAMKAGASDFVSKPWKNQKLLTTILSAIQLRETKKEVQKLKGTQQTLSEDIDQPFADFIGNSPAIRRVQEMINRVAGTDADVLILGENGTGKELVARAIHRQSMRTDKVFISVDLGAISETLFESELFGHTKGSFTDAKQDKAGRFEIASGGTLFLDEIGNLSLGLQSKLLTVLQNRKVQRVGSHKEIPVDFRLISATNMPLNEMTVEKKFRQDLLYRINTVEIRVPPLRERIEDIPLLANFFLRRYGTKYKRPGKKIDKSVLAKLTTYSWPGNIRELQHAIERAVILSDDTVIRQTDLVVNVLQSTATSGDAPMSMDDMEKQFIIQSLAAHEGHVSNTAKTLGMTRTALYRRMKKHNIRKT
jgi:DNA-binding NtrC family response regulator